MEKLLLGDYIKEAIELMSEIYMWWASIIKRPGFTKYYEPRRKKGFGVHEEK